MFEDTCRHIGLVLYENVYLFLVTLTMILQLLINVHLEFTEAECQ